MKKHVLINLVTLGLLLTGCNIKNTSSDDKSYSSIQPDSGNFSSALKLEEGTPDSWISLFTFDNVTILLKNNLTIKTGDHYKCVEGQWYYCGQSDTSYVPHDGRNIFDLYLTNYSVFTYDESNSCYKANDWAADESGYLRYINIYINEGKISSISDSAVLNSSVIESSLVFSDYGTTTL